MSEENTLNRHKMRILAMKCVYQHLLLGKDIRKCVFEATKSYNIDGYLYELTIGTVEHEKQYIEKIQPILRKDWSFDRLSLIEQAILLVSAQEILALDTPKPVVINEAITIAKKYCDDDSYKMINGILDQL